jgi:hypothetical protein
MRTQKMKTRKMKKQKMRIQKMERRCSMAYQHSLPVPLGHLQQSCSRRACL